jgi:predicted N-acetyltransferase YhbS
VQESETKQLEAEKFCVVYRPDGELTDDDDNRLRRLLFASFPHELGFLKRRFLRERPAHRWLLLDDCGELIGHAAVHEKTIGTNRGNLKVGGLAEVCVSSRYRRRGLVARMLAAIHAWLAERGFAFSMLFGSLPVYRASGYELIGNEIVSANSFAWLWNRFRGKPMVKPLAGIPWPDGPIDLRGPRF